MFRFLFGIFLFLGLVGGGIFAWNFMEVPKKPTSSSNILETIPQMEVVPEPEKQDPPPPLTPEKLSDASALITRGDGFFASHFLQMAIDDYSDAVSIAPNTKEAWGKLIRAQVALRNYSDAEKIASSATKTFPNNEDFLITLGDIYLQESKFRDAHATFTRLPNGGARAFYLGVMATFFKDYSAARELLELAKTDQKFFQKSELLLNAYRSADLTPDTSPEYLDLLLAKAMNDLDFFEMSMYMSKEVVKTRADYRDAWILLGHNYLSLEHYGLAVNVLKKANELDPEYPEGAYILGLAEAEFGETDAAITHLLMAQENGFTPRKEVVSALAEIYLKTGLYDEARKKYEELISLGDKKAGNYVQPVSISLQFLKKPSEAKLLAREAVYNNPNSEVAQNLLGWALLENEEYAEAQKILDALLLQNPEFQPARFNRAQLFEKQEQWADALDEYEKAYRLSPYSALGGKAAERYNEILSNES